MAVTSDGVIYLGDGSRILQMTEDTEPTLYAGSAGESGAVNGALLVARFSSLGAFAVSSSGDLFVCDDDKVRKISGDTVSTVYTAPSSSNLKGIAVDSSGNAYVTEYNNGLITKITSKGVSVFTSQSNANGIAIDSSDNIYVSHNQQVVAFTPDGTMSIVAGNEYWTSGYADGNFTSARFRYPGPLAIGSDGNLYVADTGNYCIRKVSLTTKEVTSYAGTCTSSGVADGVAAESSFQKIWAIAALADNVFYERDSMSGSDQRVRKIYGLSSSSSASSGSSATSGVSSSSGPVSVLVSSGTYLTMDGGIAMASNGIIYLSDGSRILKMTEGSAPVLYAGKAGDDGDADGARLDARFLSENVGALALSSSDDLFICDYYKVRKISGNTVSTLYSGTSGLSYRGIAVDSSGNVFITDYYNGKITKITSKGVASTFSTSLSNPSGIVIDSADNIYVTDNNRVIKFTSGGAMTVLAGTTSSGLVDGTGTSARFNTPDSLAIGSDGDLFIADRVNYCIRRLNLATTEVTTSVESGPFNSIWGMAAAADNVLYVRDRYSASIQRVLKVYTA